MPTEDIPFPLTSAPGSNVFSSAGRLVNCFAEPLVAGARGQNVWRRSGGTIATAVAHTGWRGGLVVGSTLYAAFSGSSGKVSTFTNSFAETSMGNLAGTQKVFWAHNDKATPDVIVVDPSNGAFQVTTSPSVIDYPDTNVGSPNSCSYQDGYFFFTYGDGTCRVSAIDDTPVNLLDFTIVNGNEGGLLRAVPFGGEMYLCGTNTIQPFQDTANPTGFPYTRVLTIPIGIIGRYAITGYEPAFGKGIIFVGNDQTVYALNGYIPEPVSTPDVARAINSFCQNGGSVEDIAMWPYTTGDHSFAVLQLGTVATWVFDVDNLRWHERFSNGLTYWRAYDAVYFNEATRGGNWVAGDALTANVATITSPSETMFELKGSAAVANIPFILESGPVTAFPNRLQVAQSTFEMARGVGMATGIDPEQTDPSVLIQWSDDGGLTWAAPVIRKLGPQQTSPGPVRVNRCGVTKDEGRRWRITAYDPVEISLTGGKQSDTIRNY